MCTLDALLGISRTIDLPLGALMDHLQPNGRCWCCDVGQTSCWRPPFFFVFLLHFPFFLLHMTLHRERAANNGQKRRTALNYGRSHQNCTIWKLSWQLPWYSGHYDARKSRKTAAKKHICSRVCKGQAGGISPPFHCHFTFRRCAKRCGETKSPFFGVQDAGCRIQNSKWFGEKNAPFKGIRQSVGNRLLVCPVACSLMHLTRFFLLLPPPLWSAACSSLCPGCLLDAWQSGGIGILLHWRRTKSGHRLPCDTVAD